MFRAYSYKVTSLLFPLVWKAKKEEIELEKRKKKGEENRNGLRSERACESLYRFKPDMKTTYVLGIFH